MRVVFMGRKQSAAEILQWTINQGIEVAAVVTDSHIRNSITTLVAHKLGIPLLTMEDVENELRKDPMWVDLVISYLFWRKLRTPIIDVPRLGCLNFHPAILPEYRGLGGYNIAILNRLTQWGTTAHYVDAAIDTGKIIDVYSFSFDYQLETAHSLEKKTLKLQQDLYKSVLHRVVREGKLQAKEQDGYDGKYINKAQMLGMMKIDPEKDDIDLKIQAFWFPPYHGAYIELNGQKYTLVNDYILSQLANDDQTFQK